MKNITHVDAAQVALLINTGTTDRKKVGDINKMFQVVESRLHGKTLADPPPTVISVSEFEDVYPNYPIRQAIDSIAKNYLKPGATGGFIMNYPITILNKPNGKLPNSISIPGNLRSFLSEEQIEEILTEWRKRFAGFEIEFK